MANVTCSIVFCETVVVIRTFEKVLFLGFFCEQIQMLIQKFTLISVYVCVYMM
jgi:hypothetical protein